MKDTNMAAHLCANLLSTGHRFIAESEMLEEAINSLRRQGRLVSNQAVIRLLQLLARYTPAA